MKKNHRFDISIAFIVIALSLLVLRFLTFITNYRTGYFCDHDKLIKNITNISFYISIITFVLFVLLVIIFRKKSDKFYKIFLMISSIFIFVIPIGLDITSYIIHKNDSCSFNSWKNVKCIKRNETGKCLKYDKGDE